MFFQNHKKKSQVLTADMITAIADSSEKGNSLWQDAARRFLNNKVALGASFLLLFIVLFTLFGPYLSHFDFRATDWSAIFQAPSVSSGHFFGTDNLGRDIYVRTLLGGRISLLIGIVSSIVSIVVGIAYGATAGLIGGKVDGFMMRFVDILYALPFMFFVIVLVTFFGRHLILIFAAIGLINWLDMARIVRGQTLSLKNKEFIEAAEAYGASRSRIIFRHLVPNVLGVVIIYATLLVPQVILVESFLSFLGLGVQEPSTSWGVLVNEGAKNMSVAWWNVLFPAIMLTISLLCFNCIGDGLRDALDPKNK